MASKFIERIRIPEENTIRAEIAAHPLFKTVQALAEVDLRTDYEREVKNQLRRGTELSRNSHAKLFALCDTASGRLGLDVNMRLFKSRAIGGAENAFVKANDRDILLVFEEGIVAALEDEQTLLSTIGHELGHYAFGHITDRVSWSIAALDSNISALDEGAIEDGAFAKKLGRLRRDLGWDELVLLQRLLRQIGELNADRAGLVSSQSFDACVRSSMILSGGPADRFGTYDPADYLAQARQLVASGDIFDESDWFSSHPLQPLRVLALEYFGNSDAYRDVTGGGTGKNRLAEFSRLLPSIVPMDILGSGRDSAESQETIRSVRAKSTVSGITDLELDMLSYLCMAQIVGADGKITPAERTFLELQIRPAAALDAVHRALDALPDDGLATELDRLLLKAQSLPTRSKGALVKRMIKAAKADRRITEEEIARIRELAGAIDAADQAEREIANVWGR